MSAQRVCLRNLTGSGLIAIAMLAGCGGSDRFGEEIAVRQRDGTVLRGYDGRSAVTLGADRPFNVTDTQRQSEGTAVASSIAKPHGTASCVADASNGGLASAEFQLGHVINFGAQTSIEATVMFNIDYECALAGDPSAHAEQPVRLKAYVMDSNHRLLGRVMLAQGDRGGLPEHWTATQAHSFGVTFEPGMAYHLIVAGRVEASAEDAPGPSATLTINSLRIAVQPTP